jgi:hypothetical protein
MNRRLLTDDELRERLRAACAEEGGMRAFGRKHGITAVFISQVLNNQKSPTPRLARLIGLTPVNRWAITSDTESECP